MTDPFRGEHRVAGGVQPP